MMRVLVVTGFTLIGATATAADAVDMKYCMEYGSGVPFGPMEKFVPFDEKGFVEVNPKTVISTKTLPNGNREVVKSYYVNKVENSNIGGPTFVSWSDE